METVDFGAGAVKARGKTDIFLVKYDPNGKQLWSKQFGGNDDDVGAGLAVDEFGNLILAGWFWRTIDFGGGPRESAGQNDMVLDKFGPDGSHLWSHSYGGDQPDFARGVALTKDGAAVLVAGTYRRPIKLGETELSYEMDGQNPTGDAFVAVLEP